MKYITLLFIALIFAGCNGNNIEVTGTADGVGDATITLKNSSGETLSGVNLKDGKFNISKTHLDYPDYGTLIFSMQGKDDISFELYLEPGEYNIVFDKTKLAAYPHITSKSEIQNQLSNYRHLFEAMSWDASQKLKALELRYKEVVKSPKMWDDSTTKFVNNLENERSKLSDVGWQALSAFIAKYPKNQIAAHVMQSMSMDMNPNAYYAVYQKFNAEQKNTDEGKEIGTRLKSLIRLQPGAQAPEIVGTLPDGKPFDIKSIHKKVILVEFWKAGNYQSRLNHQSMFKSPQPEFMNNDDVAIISVSFDKKRDWWLGSMRDDKLTWPQVSDLKGSDSPNWANWDIQSLPTYCLLDASGHIIENNLGLNEIDLVAGKYLKTH